MNTYFCPYRKLLLIKPGLLFGGLFFFIFASPVHSDDVNPPTISRISPSLGPVGQWVYVRGKNFVKDQTTVSVGGVSEVATLVYASDQLGFTVPLGANGTTLVSVTTPYGEAFSQDYYTVGIPTDPPTVSGFSPDLGPVGQWVYVSGTNFVWGQTTVEIAGVAGITAAIYGPNSLGFTVPSGASGSSPITVTTPFGTAISAASYTIGVPSGQPKIERLREYIGYNWVYVSGENFVNGQTKVKIGNDYEVNAAVYSPTSLGFRPSEDWTEAPTLKVLTPNGQAVYPLKQFFKLQFKTEKGKRYQIQSSPNANAWSNLGAPLDGEDAAYRMLSDMSQRSTEFFRVVVIDVED